LKARWPRSKYRRYSAIFECLRATETGGQWEASFSMMQAWEHRQLAPGALLSPATSKTLRNYLQWLTVLASLKALITKPGGDDMRKEARTKAESIFLEVQGKISNVEIAKRVGAHPLTVGKWKRDDDWTGKLASGQAKLTEKGKTAPVRKKTAHEQAFKLYVEAGGKISNKALADKVGVSAASISNWKTAEGWSAKLQPPPAPELAVLEKTEAPAETPPPSEAPLIEEIEIDLDELAAPDHIKLLNKQIGEILAQRHLSPIDLKTIAEAKEAVLRAVIAYLEVMEMASED
jgi:transposase